MQHRTFTNLLNEIKNMHFLIHRNNLKKTAMHKTKPIAEEKRVHQNFDRIASKNL